MIRFSEGFTFGMGLLYSERLNFSGLTLFFFISIKLISMTRLRLVQKLSMT